MRRGGFSRTRGKTIVLAVNDIMATATRGIASFVIQVQGRGDTRIPVKAMVLPRISAPLPSSRIEIKPRKHLEGLKLADAQYDRPGPVDILPGAAVLTSLLRVVASENRANPMLSIRALDGFY